ncbi:uncharacterized protein PAN0_002c1072 [Moesziomyces antarcticus]|uniref:Related to conserved hypothetical Ustilaginaceae-specific protein n=1 Tax=Pseudozyma antarctica TaxID=84753 RepID=A0A5C3FJ28_PSEA2|nr:uncharacterized protein PAN0_002c1072 [Moesziomyces antarcticus]GAK62870.1 conserved hypothetical protein [Moesziomyces antarcticus]SPO43657.1 related to conserved hypothetical Ustilaginaceae-specific protein [Moesziomyces antarcticus]
MSDLDIDDASLPSDDDVSCARPALDSSRRPAYGTLSVQAEDEPVSASRVLQDMRSSAGSHHRLCLQHAELGDDKTAKVLQALFEHEPRPDAAEQPTTTDDTDSAAASQWAASDRAWRYSSSLDLPQWKAFRIVELDNNELTSASLPPICTLLERNPLLHTLSLKGNELDGDAAAYIALARVLAASPLRRLSLSSNPISHRALAAFMDSLPPAGTSLECLELSNVLPVEDDASEPGEERMVAAKAVASFIADAARCRSVKTLLLNGNGFGSRGVRSIVAALIGSASSLDSAGDVSEATMEDAFYDTVFRARLRRPNRSLEVLELAGNIERGWLPQDPQEQRERLKAIRKRYACVAHDEIETIVAFLDLRARRARLNEPAPSEQEVPIEIARHMKAVGVQLDEWERDFEEAAEIGAGLTVGNWQALKQLRLEQNAADGERCRQAATAVLAAARIVGCTAQRVHTAPDGAQQGFHRFLDLPPELRLMVLKKLDTYSVMSARQFTRAISFACERTTIGYGEPHFDGTRVRAASDTVSHSTTSSATLPAQRWSWQQCFEERAAARDWAADRLDASDQSAFLRSRTTGAHMHATANHPGLYAFLESTMCHRAE